jgi:hypothetical protein
MTLKPEILTTAWHLGPHGKMFPEIGYVRYAVRKKSFSTRQINRSQRFLTSKIQGPLIFGVITGNHPK